MKKDTWAAVGWMLFALLVLLMGLMVLGLFTPHWIDAVGLGRELVKTTGKVVGINTWTESGDTYHSPDVRYTVEDGRQFTVDMWCPPFGCFADAEIGSEVAVVYPRNDPGRPIADTLAGRAIAPTFMLLVGLVFIVIGATGLWFGANRLITIRRLGVEKRYGPRRAPILDPKRRRRRHH